MNMLETLKVASEGVWLNKVRSFLTILGIIIGAATIILVIGIGKGSEAAVNDQYSQLSVTTIYVNAGTQGQGGGGNAKTSKLSIKDVDVILDNCPSILKVSPQIVSKVDAGYGINKLQPTVLGVSENYNELTNLAFMQGDFLTDTAVANKEKVAVIGYEVALGLFDDLESDLVGQYVNVNKQKYLIAGILKSKGESMGGVSIDDSILIPHTTAERYITGTTVKPRLVVQAKDLNSVRPAMEEITIALREAHNLRPGVVDDFTIKDAGSKLASAQETAKTMSLLLISVAGIVLLVGGIGVMNVMLVSVRERIKEIGTRIALGARKRDILRQFLLESILLSLAGGILGICLGMLALPLMEKLDLSVIQSAEAILLAILFALSVGVFFGFYPAKKAAGLDPIDSLRYE